MIEIKVKKQLKAFTMDVNIKFGREIAILTGPNGSGKSTLLRTVAGLERPDAGCINVMGEIFFDASTDLSPDQRRVGYVCQEGALFPWLTVEKNVLFGLDRNARKDRSEWLDGLFEELEIKDLKRRYPGSLSGGEAQRVALARALAPRPRLLLLDEPFSAMDTAVRPRLRALLKEMQQEWEIPVLMVTHDHAEAYILGDRIFELKEGKVALCNERGKVIRMPLVSY